MAFFTCWSSAIVTVSVTVRVRCALMYVMTVTVVTMTIWILVLWTGQEHTVYVSSTTVGQGYKTHNYKNKLKIPFIFSNLINSYIDFFQGIIWNAKIYNQILKKSENRSKNSYRQKRSIR